MNERDKVIKFAYDEIKKRIIDKKVSIQDSLSFCKLVLDSMPKNREYIIMYFNKNYDEILPEVTSQDDFIKTLKIFDLFLSDENETSKMILNNTIEKLIQSVRNMPDELWKVRVLSQLSEKILNMVLLKLTQQEINDLLYICPQVVNSETVEKVIKVIIEGRQSKRKLILKKKR